jgi:hypothetical protein
LTGDQLRRSGKFIKNNWSRNAKLCKYGGSVSKGGKMKPNKYLYGWKIYVNYGQGWEYEVFETSWRETRDRLREYRANCQYPIKASRGRELND